jgi:hypothetical protein
MEDEEVAARVKGWWWRTGGGRERVQALES